MSIDPSGVGQPGFVGRHGLASPEREALAQEVMARIRSLGLRTVRLAVVDQHGVPRGKMLSPEAAIAAMSDGLDFSGAIYSLDTGNQVFVPAFARGGGFGIEEFTGFPDVMLVPDPAYVPGPAVGGSHRVDAVRRVLRQRAADAAGRTRAAAAGPWFAGRGGVRLPGRDRGRVLHRGPYSGGPLSPVDAGFTPPPPAVSVFERGYQYLSEVRLDGMGPVLEAVRDALDGVGLLPRSMEDEWGPGQIEVSFSPIAGLAAADAAVLFRSAVKQVCQRRGLLATFMCRPALPNFFSSGWHLHQSLLNRPTRSNAFASASGALSDVGRRYVAGLLEHTAPMAVFAVPTVNGYKRFRPYSFAPDRVSWAEENRGALVRVQGAPGDASSHVEMRLGEPAANPYFYLASNIAAGMDGIRRNLEPPPPVSADPYAAEAPPLPGSLSEAVDGAGCGPVLPVGVRGHAGRLPGHDEAGRDPPVRGRAGVVGGLRVSGGPAPDVSDWEMREYFEFF